MRKKTLKTLGIMVLGAALLAAPAPLKAAEVAGGADTAPENGWYGEAGKRYWYENGVKQGTEGRGKEIYDPASDAWYWLDSVQNGAVAVSKDVYQESYAGGYADKADGTGKWVRYDENGHMVKGWCETAEGTYYFDEETGAMAKGIVQLDGYSYHFDVETGLFTGKEACSASGHGWYEEAGKKYWYERGVRQGMTGRGKEIYDRESDAWYWLDAVQDGAVAVSKDVYQPYTIQGEDEIGKWVRYDEKGHMVKGWDKTEAGTYYFDENTGAMMRSGWVNLWVLPPESPFSEPSQGTWYRFDETTGILWEGTITLEEYGELGFTGPCYNLPDSELLPDYWEYKDPETGEWIRITEEESYEYVSAGYEVRGIRQK